MQVQMQGRGCHGPRGSGRGWQHARALLAAAVLPTLLQACGPSTPASAQAPTASAPRGETGQAVRAEVPRRETITRQVHAVGTLAARHEDQVATELGGLIVTAVLVEPGMPVARGQVLARLGTELLESQLAIRTARREEAAAALEHARLVLARSQQLRQSQGIAEEEFERHRTDMLTAKARLEAAEAEVKETRTRLAKAVVLAPDAGVVLQVNAAVGQATNPGQPLFTIMRQGRIEWRAEVPAIHLGQVRVGQKGRITVADGGSIEGDVWRIAPVVQVASRTGIVHVQLPPSPQLRPGQFARGILQVGSGEALTLPLAAVASRNDEHAVFVMEGSTVVRRRPVTLGQVLGDRVEVRGGVSPQDRVVTQGAGYLADGARVTLLAAPAAAKP